MELWSDARLWGKSGLLLHGRVSAALRASMFSQGCWSVGRPRACFESRVLGTLRLDSQSELRCGSYSEQVATNARCRRRRDEGCCVTIHADLQSVDGLLWRRHHHDRLDEACSDPPWGRGGRGTERADVERHGVGPAPGHCQRAGARWEAVRDRATTRAVSRALPQ